MKYDWIEISGIVLCAAMFFAATATDATQPYRGEWNINGWGNSDTVHLELKHRSLTSLWGWSQDHPIGDLRGLTRDQLRSAKAPVKFTLERDAGAFVFEGTVIAGFGSGGYRFVPNPQYASQLASIGYDRDGADDLFGLAVRDISLAFAREVKQAGIRDLAVRDLVRFRDHGVDLGYIRDLAMIGYPELSANDLVMLKDHGVNTGFLRALKKSGYSNLSANDAIRLRDHGVDEGFMASLKDSGYDKLNAEEITRLRDHGVEPRYIQDLAKSGYRRISVEDIVKLRDHGVDAGYVARVQASGFRNLTVDQIITLRDHGVN